MMTALPWLAATVAPSGDTQALGAAVAWLVLVALICIAYARFMNRIEPRE